MTEEHAVVFARKAFKCSYIYRFPEDMNKCYHFRIMNSNHKTPSLVCPACYTIYQRCHKKKESLGVTVVLRSFCGGQMKTDPRLNHLDGCEPMLYLTIMQKLQMTENNTQATASDSGFPLLHVQKYTYSVVHRLKDDASLCYRFYIRRRGLSKLMLRCESCILENRSRTVNNYNCIPSGFTSDPRLGHLPGCAPLLYNDVIKENEIIEKDEAEKVIFEKKSFEDESEINTTSNELSTLEELTNCNLANIHVIEVRQAVSYIYRLSTDETKCYRFIFNRSSKAHILMTCCSCNSVNNRKRSKGPATTWASDGYTMHEDPTRNHFPECEPESFSDALNTFRILDDENPAPKGGFPLIRKMKIGQRNLMYTLPTDTTKCYHFQFEQSTHAPYCATCYAVIRKNNLSIRRRKYKVLSTGFLDDPLLNHLPECKPQLKNDLLNRYQLVDSRSAMAIMGLLKMTKTPKNRLSKDNTAISAVHVIEKITNSISYIYRMKNDLEKCYRFYIRRDGIYSTMKCACCVALCNKHIDIPAISRDYDVLSLKLDPSLDHRPECRPLNYVELCKTHRQIHVSTIDGFLDDPRLNHVVGCEPLLYSDVTKDYRFVDESRASHLFSYGDAKYDNSVPEVNSAIKQKNQKTHISEQHPVKTKAKPTTRRSGKEISEQSDENNSISQSSTNAVESSEADMKATHDDNQDTIDEFEEECKPIPLIPTSEHSENPNPNVKLEEQEAVEKKPKVELGNIDHIKPEIFKYSFDIPFFSEDEVEVNVIGRTIRVECSRELELVGGSLSYSLVIPDSIDISSIKCLWEEGSLELTATMNL